MPHVLLVDDDPEQLEWLTEFVKGAIPKYAILSHTWGADTEEVSIGGNGR